MAQRISRARQKVSSQPFAQPGDVAVALRVLYLIFNEGYSGRLDLSAEAIRLTRQLMLACDEPEVAGLLALMLLHHARRSARTGEHGALISLDQQDRTRWNEAEITEGVRVLQAALARDQRGECQIQAAIAALHDDARTAAVTDWPQILAWYDELIELTGNPVAALGRAIAVGEVNGPPAPQLLIARREESYGPVNGTARTYVIPYRSSLRREETCECGRYGALPGWLLLHWLWRRAEVQAGVPPRTAAARQRLPCPVRPPRARPRLARPHPARPIPCWRRRPSRERWC